MTTVSTAAPVVGFMRSPDPTDDRYWILYAGEPIGFIRRSTIRELLRRHVDDAPPGELVPLHRGR